MKSRATFCPIGPFIMTADEIPDPQNLPVRLWNNGTLMQDFNTDDMAYSIAESIAFISSVHPLEPGDIVATGTNHRGVQLNDARQAVEQWVFRYDKRCWLRQLTPHANREQEDRLGLALDGIDESRALRG